MLLVGLCVTGCGGSGPPRGTSGAAGTSLAAAVVAFLAPRDGADAVIGAQMGNFAQTVQTKLLDDCMASDGFAAPPFPMGGTPSDLGNAQFPNLPVIEASHSLGLFTGPPSFVDPESGMSNAERVAWQARMGHCFNAVSRQTPLFGSAKFNQLNSGWFNVVNQVEGSGRIRALSKRAARCSAAHHLRATSVMSLYSRLQNEIGPLSSSGADAAKVQSLQAKGASVLVTCWTAVIDETTALLSDRQATFLSEHADAVAALENQVNGQMAAIERRYGITLTVVAP